jgi:molybdopterin-binding protein
MKISARNCLAGTVRQIQPGAVNAKVTLDIAPGISIVSIITNDAVKELGLTVGRRAYGLIKASNVMIGIDEQP